MHLCWLAVLYLCLTRYLCAHIHKFTVLHVSQKAERESAKDIKKENTVGQRRGFSVFEKGRQIGEGGGKVL